MENVKITELIIGNNLFNNTNIKSLLFPDENSLENFNDNSNKNIIAGIIFYTFNNTLTEYNIRMNHGFVPKPSLNAIIPSIHYNSNITDSDEYLNYFVPLQSAVEQAIIQYKTNLPIQVSIKYGGLEMSINRGRENRGISMNCIMYNLAIFILSMTLPKYILFEKENGVKKTLTLIGVKSFSYYFSWILIYILLNIVFAFTILIEDIIFKNLTIMNGLCKFIFIVLNEFSMLSLLSFMSLFFKKSISFMNFLNYAFAIYYILLIVMDTFSVELNEPINILFLDLFLPGFSFYKAVKEIHYKNYLKENCLINLFYNPELIRNVLYIIFSFTLYTTLICLIENHTINEDKSFINIFKFIFNFKKKKEQLKSNEKYIESIEMVDSNAECIAEISEIYKIFKSGNKNQKNNSNIKKNNLFYAVNNVSFKVYENEIFGILGHNGAGKTTLINILTGIINPDHGRLYYEGKDFLNDKYNIRKKFGKYIISTHNIYKQYFKHILIN